MKALMIWLFCFGAIAIQSLGQSVTARLDLEVVPTEKFGKLLSVKAIVKNNSNEKIYLERFPYLLTVEKFNSTNGTFEDYYSNWFAEMMHDSLRDEMAQEIGIVIPSRDKVFERESVKEIEQYNSSTHDLEGLSSWIEYQVAQLKILNPLENLEYRFNVTGLPKGTYRFIVSYSNNSAATSSQGHSRYEGFRLPDKIGTFKRWIGSFDSNVLFLTVK